MRKLSIVLILLLTGCTALQKNSDELKKIGHDIVDEEIDNGLSNPQ
jgi:hypothetical protein